MSLEKIKAYLSEDLTNSIVDDVKPCLNLSSNRGGYFAVPRLVLSYISYLGVLIRADHMKFIKDVFGTIDYNYKRYGDLFWEIYRNGLVHKYEPGVLENTGHQIRWFLHKFNRTAKLQNGLQIVHLVPQKIDNSDWIQPVSIICLYEDLLAAIDKFTLLISQNHKMEENFRIVANDLQKPTLTTIRWW